MEHKSKSNQVPVGAIIAYALATPPDNWLLCDGSAIDASYGDLITLLGSTNLPNLQGMTLVGAGTGTDSNKVSQTFKLQETGGEYTHPLTVAEMPPHTHTYIMSGFWGGGNEGSAGGSSIGDNSNTEQTESTGGDSSTPPVVTAHNNVQPYYALSFIMYAGEPS